MARATGSDTSTSVERAFVLLDRFAAAEPDGLTLAQLAAELPTAKSTIHRYLMTLVEIGAIRRDAHDRFRLGLKLVELAGALLDSDDLHSAAEPVLHALVARIGETVHLGVPDDDHVVYIAKVESSQSVRLVSRIGARVWLHCSAMGKALLARLDERSLAAALDPPYPALTPHTITDPHRLRAQLATVRAAGFAIDDEENELGVRCVGAAIVDRRGVALGAISISAPAARMSHERCDEIAPSLVDAAGEVARRLGRSPVSRSAC